MSDNDTKSVKPFKDEVLNDEQKNLFAFLQISDLHLSKFKDESRISDFKVFCSEVVDIVKPKVVSLF